MAQEKKQWPGDVQDPKPEVFNIKAMLPQPNPLKPGQLSENMVRQFFEEGYLIVDEFFTREELDPCREAIQQQVDDLATVLKGAGKIKNLYKEFGLFERLSKIEDEFPGANIILHKQGRLSKAFREVWSNPRMLNVVEQLIGPDIAGHPVWNLRTKTPQNEASTVPWHQDSAYLDNRSYEVMQLTAWIPLLDANRENGCMEVVKGGHLKGKVASHTCCWRDTWYVMLDEKEMERSLGVDVKRDTVLCPVPYGGMLLINNMIPHRSLNNISNDIRWSLDLRWQRPDKSVGFYDMKDSVLMRTKDQPNLKIDWEEFEKVDRNHAQMALATGLGEAEVEHADLDTTVQGPWMKKWEMVHQNRHTAALAEGKLSWHKN